MNKIYFYFTRFFPVVFVFCLLISGISAQQPMTKTWGFNTYGQLGNKSFIPNTYTPENGFFNYSDITSIQGGGLHTLALRATGTVLAVGQNSNGQLGNGTFSTTGCFCQFTPASVRNPQNNGFLTNVTAISAGGVHSLALTSDGKVYAWGNNFNGELGNGNNTNSNLPVQVGSDIAGFDGRVIAVDAGFLHNLALTDDGRVWAWGFNNFRQLGDGSTSNSQNSPKPVLVTQGGPQFSDVLQVAAGAFHSIALKKDGTAWVWGSNNNKQVGNPSFIGNFSDFPTQANQDFSGRFVSIAGGGYHNLALKADGTLWMWGRNFEAQLGNGGNDQNPVGEPTRNESLSNVIKIKADGSYHNLVKTREGKVFAWGNNYQGEVGIGAFIDFQNIPFELTSLETNTTIIGTGVYNSYAVTPQILTDSDNQIIRGEDFNVFLASVDTPGTTLVLPVNPAATGLDIPDGYEIQENQPAFNFSTTAELSGSASVCLKVPNVFDELLFADLRIMQSLNGNLVDQTTSSDYQRKQICGAVTSLSTFLIAEYNAPTPQFFIVSGTVSTGRSRNIAYARVILEDEDGNVQKTETDISGRFVFKDIPGSRTYTISVFYRDMSFDPQTITVNQDITNLIFTPR